MKIKVEKYVEDKDFESLLARNVIVELIVVMCDNNCFVCIMYIFIKLEG